MNAAGQYEYAEITVEFQEIDYEAMRAMPPPRPFTRRPIAIPWGSFGLRGEWEHNPLLKMSADEQRAENVRNGYLKA